MFNNALQAASMYGYDANSLLFLDRGVSIIAVTV
jgi:hypothetical protein